MISLYRLKGREMELVANYLWESKGISMEWLYGAAPLTYTAFHTNALNIGSVNISLESSSAKSILVKLGPCIERADA